MYLFKKKKKKGKNMYSTHTLLKLVHNIPVVAVIFEMLDSFFLIPCSSLKKMAL